MAIPSRVTRPSLTSAVLTATADAYGERIALQKELMGATVRISTPPISVEPVAALGVGRSYSPKTVVVWESQWGNLVLANEEEIKAACELIAFLGGEASEIVENQVVDDYARQAVAMAHSGVMSPEEARRAMGLDDPVVEHRYMWDGIPRQRTSVYTNPQMPKEPTPMVTLPTPGEGTLMYK